MRSAVCAIAKDEHNYVIEWVEHYKKLGFDHLFLYDNNIDEQHSFSALLSNYSRDFLTIIPCYGLQKYQKTAFSECYNMHYTDYDWIAFFDLDEFLMLENDLAINEFLNNPIFNNFNSICFNYKTYGDSNLVKIENSNYSVSRFITPTMKFSWKYQNYGYKKIVKTSAINHLDIDHVHYIDSAFEKQCSPNGQAISVRRMTDIDKSFLSSINYKGGWINHYCTKTLEEYINKIKRGGGVSGSYGYSLNEFFAINQMTQEKELFLKNLQFFERS